MRVRRLTSIAGDAFSARPGDVLDVPDDAGRAWIGIGDAVAADGEAVTAEWPYGPAKKTRGRKAETATAAPAPETADAPPTETTEAPAAPETAGDD